MKRIIVFLAVILLLTGCAKKSDEKPVLLEPVNAQMDTTFVTRADINDIVLYEGEVLADIEELSFETDGYLYDVFVEVGETVFEGDVLAGLYGKKYYEIIELEEEIELLEAGNARYFELLDSELEIAELSGKDTELLKLEAKHAKELSELELEQKKRRLEELKAEDIGYIYLEAESDGTVAAITNTPQNGYISAGTPVVAVEGEGKPSVTSKYLSERDYDRSYGCYAIVHGKEYELIYIPYAGDEMTALIASDIEPVARFEFAEDVPEEISGGDYAMVVLVEDYKENVVAVPVNALFSDGGSKFVYEVIDNVKVKRTVTVGASDTVYAEITDGIGEGACIYVKN